MLKLSCKLAFTVLISSFLVGCGGGGLHLPKRQSDVSIDVSKIPNAVPRNERRSRYGNPRDYEVFGKRYYLLASSKGFVETGIASWYGPNFHGKKTSSQEVYDMYKMTAAHKTLPIPCYVEVTNLQNGRSVIVRVNDRGPFHEGRIIDLSYVAAKKLGIVQSGTGRVEIRVIDPANPQAHRVRYKPKPVQKPIRKIISDPQRSRPVQVRPSSPNYSKQQTIPAKRSQAIMPKRMYVQLGAFSDLINAQNFKRRIEQVVNRPVSIASQQVQNKILYKVRIGPMNNTEAADRVSADLNAAGHYDHHVLFQ